MRKLTLGKIVKNGVTYSGSSDNADNVKYNNNASNLDATNVQEAIDKLDESVDTLNSKIENNLSDINKYSDEEIAIGTWLDNKTIYRKCYLFDNMNFSSSGFLDSEFTPSKIGKVLSIRATAYSSNNEWVDYSNGISINSSGLYMYISNIVITKLIVVIEYTKP